jgi:hypothetical protein
MELTITIISQIRLVVTLTDCGDSGVHNTLGMYPERRFLPRSKADPSLTPTWEWVGFRFALGSLQQEPVAMVWVRYRDWDKVNQRWVAERLPRFSAGEDAGVCTSL